MVPPGGEVVRTFLSGVAWVEGGGGVGGLRHSCDWRRLLCCKDCVNGLSKEDASAMDEGRCVCEEDVCVEDVCVEEDVCGR